MHSTLKLRDSDPHDDFAIVPEIVPAAWADKVLADITRDARNSADIWSYADIKKPASEQQPATSSSVTAAAPTVDTTFRTTVTDDGAIPAEPPPSFGRWTKSAVMLVLAISSAAAAAAWQNHGDAARQMVAGWVPNFAITSSPPAETAALPGPADTPAAQLSVAEQTPAAPAAPAQPRESAAPAAAAPSPDTAQLESMARDLSAMAQKVEGLKAGIAELKTSQQAMAREATRTSEAKPAEIKPAAPNPRPRTTAPPPRTAAAPPHRPLPAYPPTQAAAPAPLPQPAYPAASTRSAPPPPQASARTEDDEPIVRPPMPLR